MGCYCGYDVTVMVLLTAVLRHQGGAPIFGWGTPPPDKCRQIHPSLVMFISDRVPRVCESPFSGPDAKRGTGSARRSNVRTRRGSMDCGTVAGVRAAYPRRSFHWPRSRRANRSLISPMTLAPSREPWTAGELMSELWAVVRAPCTSSTVRMFFRTKRSRIAMAIAPPTMAVPSGRLKDAFDMMELPKNVRSTSPDETADAARDGTCGDKKIAPARNAFRSRGRAPPSVSLKQ